MITLPPGLSILNCQAGDIKVSFDKDNPLEAARAERVVQDMLKRGYIIFVYDEEEKLHRVTDFDANTNEYIIADRGYDEASPEEATSEVEEQVATAKSKSRKIKAPAKRVPADKSRAVGVARTAGG